MRISCPPHKFACYYGIDFPDPDKLLANQCTLDEIRNYLGADSIGYLDLKGMIAATVIPRTPFAPRASAAIIRSPTTRPSTNSSWRNGSAVSGCSKKNRRVCYEDEAVKAYAQAGVDVDGNTKRGINRWSAQPTDRRCSVRSADLGALPRGFQGNEGSGSGVQC